MADFDAQLPVRALATEFTTEVANSTGTTINPVEEFPQASTTSGQSGPLTQAAVTTAAPTYLDGTTSPLSLDTAGNLRTTSTFTPSGTQDVNITKVGGNAVTTTVPVSGTVSVSNFPADADAYAQGSTTSGQLGNLNLAAVTTAAPTYTTAQTSPLSLDTAGNLRVLTGSGSTTAVTGNVTVIQTTGTNLHTVVDNFPADADALAQASTTSGQLGALIMGAVTTAAPTYTTATTNPLSIDVAGNLRTSSTAVIPSVTLTYFTDASVATSATVTHSVAGPTNLDAIHGSGSGELKMTIAIGTTGSETTFWNGFTSASNQNCEFELKNTYVIPAGQSVKVTLKNRDTAAQDLYLTFVTH